MHTPSLSRWFPWTAGLAGLCIVLAGGFRFENNDDVGMYCMVQGLWQFQPTPHLFFQSSLLGWLLQALYSFAPGPDWYFILYYLLIISSGVYVVHLLPAGAFTWLMVTASCTVFLGPLQFTKAAIWLGFASAMGLRAFIMQGNRLHLLFSLLWLFAGMCYRDVLAASSFALFAGPMVLLSLITKPARNSSGTGLLLSSTLIGIMFFTNNTLAERNLPGYAAQNNRRVLINDNGLLKHSPSPDNEYLRLKTELVNNWFYPAELADDKALSDYITTAADNRQLAELSEVIAMCTYRLIDGRQNKLILLLGLLIVCYTIYKKRKITLEWMVMAFGWVLFYIAVGWFLRIPPPRVGSALLACALLFTVSSLRASVGFNRWLVLAYKVSLIALLGWNIAQKEKAAIAGGQTLKTLRNFERNAPGPVLLTYNDFHGKLFLESLLPHQLQQLSPCFIFTVGWCMNHPAYTARLNQCIGHSNMVWLIAQGKVAFIDTPSNRDLAGYLARLAEEIYYMKLVPKGFIYRGRPWLKLDKPNYTKTP